VTGTRCQTGGREEVETFVRFFEVSFLPSVSSSLPMFSETRLSFSPSPITLLRPLFSSSAADEISTERCLLRRSGQLVNVIESSL